MNTFPRVTIVIPTYSQAALLPQALGSALGQDYENLEIVVADDCSPDNTQEIVQQYLQDGRVRYYRNSSNLGRVANYKLALEKYARGEWVINLDADDYYTDNRFISKAMNLILAGNQLEKEPPIVFLQAGHTVRNGQGQALRIDLPDIEGDAQTIPGSQYFIGFHHFSHLATLFNREKAMALDFYRYDILSADIESFLRLSLHGRVILMKASVGDWVHHGANASKRLDIPTVEMNMLRIEGPYVYAKAMGIFPIADLLRWRNKMTHSYIRSYLILSLKNRGTLDGYLGHIRRYYPQMVPGITIPVALLQALLSKIRRFFAIGKKGDLNHPS